jgi:LysM repeat protein
MDFTRFLGCLTLVLGLAFQASAGLMPDSLRTEQREGQWCILHQVEQGETLYGLSRRYRVSIQELQALNPESANLGVRIGQILVVPMAGKAAAPAQAAAPAPVPAAATVPVQATAPAPAPVQTAAPATVPVQATAPAQAATPAASAASQLPDVFWHVLEADETLFTLSQRYQIPLQDLLRANPEMDPQQLKAGTRLRIPSHSAMESTASEATPAMAPSAPTGAMGSAAATRLVEAGETPNIPAQSSPERPALPAKPDYPEQPASVPASPRPGAEMAPSPGPVAASLAHPSARYHTVAPGETLYALARLYPGTTPALLQSWNGLADNNLRSGQTLIVGWEEPRQAEQPAATQKQPAQPAPGGHNRPWPLSENPSPDEEAGITTSAAPRLPMGTDPGSETIVRRSAKARGIATWIDATSPETQNGAMLALHNDAPVGSWIDVRNLMNNRTVRAKVVGRLPQNLDDSRAIVKLSQGAARELQAHDPKVLVEVVYTLP